MGLSGDNVSKETAIGHLKSGRYDEAITSLEQVLLTQSDDPQLHSCLGMAYSQTGEHSKSIGAFEKSLELQKSARAHYNLGLAYDGAGRYSEAQEQFQFAIDLDPTYTPAKEALQKVLGKIQTSTEAVQEPTIVAAAPAAPEPTVVGAPVLEQASMSQSEIIGVMPDFSTLSAPKAPPDLSAEKAQKELEWQERRKSYIKSGVAYGAICGAGFLLLIRGGLAMLAAMATGESLGTLALIMLGAILNGGIVGAIVGLWIGLTCGAENEGLLAGAITGAVFGLISGLISGYGIYSLGCMLFSAFGTGIFGFIIGKMVASSLN